MYLVTDKWNVNTIQGGSSDVFRIWHVRVSGHFNDT